MSPNNTAVETFESRIMIFGASFLAILDMIPNVVPQDITYEDLYVVN